MKQNQVINFIKQFGVLFADVGAPANILAAVSRHYALLQEWSGTVKLVGPTDETEVAEALYLDSLVAAAFLAKAFRGKDDVHDVGSGAGFPGLFLPLYFQPGTSFVLHEVRRRKASFLKTAAREMGLTNLRVQNVRVNPRAFNSTAVIARAALPPPDWLALAETLLKPTGRAALFLAGGRSLDVDAPATIGALARVDVREYVLPLTGRRRAIVVYEKWA